MSDRFDLELEFTHPYKRSRLFTQNGRLWFGRWKPPEITLDGTEEEFTVLEGQEGQLDLIAHDFYKDRKYWRVLAHVNGIDFPLEDLPPGTTLRIPPLSVVHAALQQTSARATRVDLDTVDS